MLKRQKGKEELSVVICYRYLPPIPVPCCESLADSVIAVKESSKELALSVIMLDFEKTVKLAISLG